MRVIVCIQVEKKTNMLPQSNEQVVKQFGKRVKMRTSPTYPIWRTASGTLAGKAPGTSPSNLKHFEQWPKP